MTNSELLDLLLSKLGDERESFEQPNYGRPVVVAVHWLDIERVFAEVRAEVES